MILSDSKLKEYCRQEVRTAWKERFFVQQIREYLRSNLRKILFIGGLKGTGKTVGILQSLPLDDVMWIAPDSKNAITAEGIKCLILNTAKNILVVDEFSWVEGYSELAVVLHGFVQQGKRVIISGADSISLEYLKYDKLIHRVKIIHTTYLSFDEFCEVFGKEQTYDSCIEYLRIGGLFKDCSVTSFHSLKNYVDEAIVDNVSTYMQELNPNLVKAIVYSIFYYSVCESGMVSLSFVRKSYEEFFEELGIDPAIIIRKKDFDEVVEILVTTGIMVKTENLRLRDSYKTFIVNPSIVYQLVKCIYDLQEVPNSVFDWLYESSCVCWLSTLVDENLKLGYLENRVLGKDFALYDEKSAYLFKCALGENTKIQQDDSLVGKVIESVLGRAVSARFIIYNGADKIEVLNNKEVIYTSDYTRLAILNAELFKDF